MKDTDRPRFDIAALRDLAGDKAFARGKSYHRDGQVAILSIDADRVLAQVAGTEDYHTELIGRGKNIEGECSCPAFEDWGFCKHMVAVALATNAAGPDAEAAGIGALRRIRDHLKGKSVDALVEMITELAQRDAALFRRLELAAAAVDGNEKTLEVRLRKAIDDATRARHYVEYREAAGWAKGVDLALEAIAGLVTAGRAGLALKLVDRAVDRIEAAIENIDDSDGHCSALFDRAREIHLAAAHKAQPEPLQFARELFAREIGDDYGIFHGAAALYADVLGESGLAEYRRFATEAWEKLPGAKGRERDEISDDYHRLAAILDVFAERDGDVDARIALRTKDLSSPWSYLQLAEFCLSQGRAEEALRWAEEGLWIFEDGRIDERLLFFAINLLTKVDRKSDAEVQLWRAFERGPSLAIYERLRKFGGKAARERAVEWLQRPIVSELHAQWHHPTNLLVEIFTRERMYGAAWEVVGQHRVSRDVKQALAYASEATHPREAIETYAAHVEELASGGNNAAYAEAAKLIGRMAALRSANETASYMAAFKARHGRKRNLMKLLG